MTNNKIYKDVEAGEEKVLLNNIMSLVQQLLSAEDAEGAQGDAMQTGAEIQPEKPVTMAKEEVMDDKEKEKEEVEKSTISTPADNDDTANDKAETRIESEETDITDEAIEEVAKAILKKMNFQKSKVAKSATSAGKIESALNEVAKSLKQISERQNETESAVMNILKGIGIADEVTKSYAPKNEVRKGMNASSDQTAVLEYIAKAIGKGKDAEEKDFTSNNDKVRKSLSNRDLLAALTAYKR